MKTLPLFVLLGVFTLNPLCHAFALIGPNADCKKSMAEMTWGEEAALKMDEIRLSNLSELNDQSLVGKRAQVSARNFDRDVGDSAVITDLPEIRKGMLSGCEGVRGRVEKTDQYSVTLKLDDGKEKTFDLMDKSNPQDEIFIQLLE